jgi:hypothetical protein
MREPADVIQRIDKIKAGLSNDLSTLLTSTLKDGSSPQLRQSLKTYELIEGWREAEQVVRNSFREWCRSVSRLALLLC